MSERLKKIRLARGFTQAALAELVGCASQQIGKLEKGERKMDTNWIARLAPALNCRPEDLLPPSIHDNAKPFRALAEDAVPYVANSEAEKTLLRILPLLYPGHNNAHLWQVTGRALECAGYLPEDIAIVDFDRTEPKTGDVVCAEVHDFQSGAAVTVLRIAEPPYLIADSNDHDYRKPELVDNERVKVMGTVVARFSHPWDI